MHESVLTQHEAVAAYSSRQIIELTRTAHEKAWHILEEIGAALKPGVTEAEIRAYAQMVFERNGSEKSWHRPYIHFGPHSVLTFSDEKPKESLTLGENDIAYIDIGPVIKVDGIEVEGDVGQTYVFGSDPTLHRLKTATEEIFAAARKFWQQSQPTGVDLYRYIHQLTEEAGFVFHLEPAGHLIGAFPHLGWKKGLNHYPHIPEPGIWILEIQLRHPTEPVGAFYEAVLL